MYGEDVPRCVGCNCNSTVEHILIDRADFAEVRQGHWNGEILIYLFQEISVTEIFGFLWEVEPFSNEPSVLKLAPNSVLYNLSEENLHPVS